jgi:intracellular sulfur oxidation DsrE/DsrF family protein
MITRAVLTTLLALLLTGAGAVASAQTPGAPQQAPSGTGTKAAKHHLVIQVSDAEPAKWNLALNNARNVQADLGRDNVDLEIVVYGPGIGMLKRESAVGTRIDEALMSGVQVVACENTMAGQKLTKTDMLPGIGYVPAGVTEIMLKQQQGYAYIRP